MDSHFFLARRLKMTFFRELYCLLDAFLKKRMVLATYFEDVREVLKGRNIDIKVNVIELYVVKSWWKIKFKKRKLFRQLVCFFLLFKPALTNLDKLDYVVTELLLRKKIKCDQHIAVSSLYFFFKPIMNN